MNEKRWEPLNSKRLDRIRELFSGIYSGEEYGDLASRISVYWVEQLEEAWEKKAPRLKALDLAYDPSDPLSRVQQRTVVIAYADSISRAGEPSLGTLDSFFKKWFPAVGGLHILPACRVVEGRFNDGYFSQVVRDSIHPAFGSNELFRDIMHRYFSMNDIVLGHVDIENPEFQAYLDGDDEAGRKFFTFTPKEHDELARSGAFENIFRPRPFPLFTIFRRRPAAEPYRSMTDEQRTSAMIELLEREAGLAPEPQLVHILRLFSRIKNDQMLLDEDYRYITGFIEWLNGRGADPVSIFTKSLTQEVEHYPYIFIPEIEAAADLLSRCGFTRKQAERLEKLFEQYADEVFGREIKTLTTFSHVQADVSTASFEGLRALADDLIWYLSMDLNMLRLDAVNYAFKKWGTSCFGLPELDRLMEIVYISMECISPRMIPNLEVNDSLTTVLTQMSREEGAPPMMHDFHLASLLPAVFHSRDPGIIGRIFDKIAEFDLPGSSIRFSLSESHDGKSVRGSLDLLTFEERMVLTAAVKENGGYVKYKSVPQGRCAPEELSSFCGQIELNYSKTAAALFKKPGTGSLELKDGIGDLSDLIRKLPALAPHEDVASFFFSRIIEGRDPYELCITTRDSLPPLGDEDLEAERFLAFETLAFAVMGRNVKTVYFNDLLALPNDYERVKETGELRNIKRTKVLLDDIEPALGDPGSFTGRVVRGMNDLIALVDSDPALSFRGHEASFIRQPEGSQVAVIKNSCGESESLALINLGGSPAFAGIPAEAADGAGRGMYDNIGKKKISPEGGLLKAELPPFGRMWLSREPVEIPAEKLFKEP